LLGGEITIGTWVTVDVNAAEDALEFKFKTPKKTAIPAETPAQD
jgi:hypothetical protein